MRPRMNLLAGPLALGLTVPPLVFLAALFLRAVQPVQHEPAATAYAVLGVFHGLPRAALVGLLVVAPVAALLLAAGDQWWRWRHDAAWRTDVALLAVACLRLFRSPLAVLSALALLGSALWLVLLVDHLIAG